MVHRIPQEGGQNGADATSGGMYRAPGAQAQANTFFILVGHGGHQGSHRKQPGSKAQQASAALEHKHGMQRDRENQKNKSRQCQQQAATGQAAGVHAAAQPHGGQREGHECATGGQGVERTGLAHAHAQYLATKGLNQDVLHGERTGAQPHGPQKAHHLRLRQQAFEAA